MTVEQFNPFEDRLSRDIRNSLSSGLTLAIEKGDQAQLKALFQEYRQQSLAPPYTDYLASRERRYQIVLQQLQDLKSTDPIARAVILWNQQLFFEVHEVLEHAWYDAKGREKETLQALIRSAGVYIKLRYGFWQPAERIAAKAIPVLVDNQSYLDQYFSSAILIRALQDLQSPPPTLC